MGHLHRVAPNKKTTQGIKFETNSKGQILDANTKEVLEPGKMDRGHKYGFEERAMQRCAEKCHMSQKDYRNMMQNPQLYQWESSYNNRSGKFECKDFSEKGPGSVKAAGDSRTSCSGFWSAKGSLSPTSRSGTRTVHGSLGGNRGGGTEGHGSAGSYGHGGFSGGGHGGHGRGGHGGK